MSKSNFTLIWSSTCDKNDSGDEGMSIMRAYLIVKRWSWYNLGFFKDTRQTRFISTYENLWNYGNKTSWGFVLGVGRGE